MTRPLLSSHGVSPEAADAMKLFHADAVQSVIQALEKNQVVVVGMAHNPFVRKARQALDDAGVAYSYMEFGSYWNQWRRRLAIKLWSGWPTFPQVFVKGVLIGGANDLSRALQDGGLQKRLST